jgi:hypothetical protein
MEVPVAPLFHTPYNKTPPTETHRDAAMAGLITSFCKLVVAMPGTALQPCRDLHTYYLFAQQVRKVRDLMNQPNTFPNRSFKNSSSTPLGFIQDQLSADSRVAAGDKPTIKSRWKTPHLPKRPHPPSLPSYGTSNIHVQPSLIY